MKKGKMTVEEIQKIIDEFNSLDLSTYPQDEADAIFRKIRKFPVYSTVFHTGMVVHRARPNDNGDTYSKRNDLSYKPQEFNKTYQRASTPNQTMFYGAVIPTENLEYELDSERVIAASEASYLLRAPNEYEEGEQRIVYGKWRIIGDCRLATILFTDEERNITPYSIEACKRFVNWLDTEHPDYAEQAKLLTDFFAHQYAQGAIKNGEDYKYLLTANFSETMVRMGLNGVIFPSVRIEERGINVAIEPNFVNNHMRLEAVCECTIHKKGKKIIVNNQRMAFTKPEDQSFELKEIEIGDFRAEDEVIKEMLNQ